MIEIVTNNDLEGIEKTGFRLNESYTNTEWTLTLLLLKPPPDGVDWLRERVKSPKKLSLLSKYSVAISFLLIPAK